MNKQNEHIALTNKVATLVPLQQLHTKELQQYAINEPNIWQFSLFNPGGSAEKMEQYIQLALQEKLENKSYPFVILDNKTNTVAGSTRFYDIDFENKNATIGYTWYGSKFRRTGLNRNVKLLMLTFAFEQWQMERIEFRADANNHASINAMKQIGCVEEGIIRSHAIIPNGRRNSMVLSILKSEWENGVKQMLVSKIYDK